MKGIIEKVEPAKTKDGARDYIKVYFKDRKFPTPVYDSMKDYWPLCMGNIGKEVEFKFHKDGEKFILDDIIGDTNQNTVQPTPSPVQQAPAQPQSYLQESISFSKDDSIIRQVAAKAAAELYQGSKDTLAMLSAAQLIQRWIKGEYNIQEK